MNQYNINPGLVYAMSITLTQTHTRIYRHFTMNINEILVPCGIHVSTVSESDHRNYVTIALNCLAVSRGDHEHTSVRSTKVKTNHQ